jgi:hypothetical protein
MSESEYDDTDMSPEEFEERMAAAVPTIEWQAEPRASTGASAVTRSEAVRLAGNQTITGYLELAGT